MTLAGCRLSDPLASSEHLPPRLHLRSSNSQKPLRSELVQRPELVRRRGHLGRDGRLGRDLGLEEAS
jgi:hypothetical protein